MFYFFNAALGFTGSPSSYLPCHPKRACLAFVSLRRTGAYPGVIAHERLRSGEISLLMPDSCRAMIVIVVRLFLRKFD